MPLNPKGLYVKVSDQEPGQQAALQVQAVRQREDVRVPGLGPQVRLVYCDSRLQMAIPVTRLFVDFYSWVCNQYKFNKS